jgi:hypothetical protein
MLRGSGERMVNDPDLRNCRWLDAPGGSSAAASNTIAVVSMTLARTEAEAGELLRALRALSKSGLPVFLGEGGSGPAFVESLKRLPGTHVCSPDRGARPTLVNQLRTAFAAAQSENPDFFLYTEPDKRTFFNRGLLSLADAARRSERPAGIVVAARSAADFATFPPGQRAAESLMNQVCGEALHLPGDYTYGPLLISRRLIPYLKFVPEDLGWGWRFFLLGIARQLGVPVELCPVPGRCPPSQRGEDDERSRGYRLRQLVQNVTGLANGWIDLLHQGLDLQPAAPN